MLAPENRLIAAESNVKKLMDVDDVFEVVLPTGVSLIVPDAVDKIVANIADLTVESQREGEKFGKGLDQRSFTSKQQIRFNERGGKPVIDVYLK
jgi:hypothetical protein